MKSHEADGALAPPSAPAAGKACEIIEAAPAKINLALHVTGQRADGYHLIETLVAFAKAGDTIRIRDNDEDRFSISGRFAPALESADPADNLVLKARDRLRDHACQAGYNAPPVDLHLVKALPVASGIGGGSADAAATLRGLVRHWRLPIDQAALRTIALELGADVPMCLAGHALIARGIGEEITPLAGFGPLFMVLVNPLKPVSTPAVFRLLARKDNPPLPAMTDEDWHRAIGTLRNDLQPPAVQLLPDIATVLDHLAAEGADMVRMSGSGATCFGLYATSDKAEAAARRLSEQRPDWYVEATTTNETNF